MTRHFLIIILIVVSGAEAVYFYNEMGKKELEIETLKQRIDSVEAENSKLKQEYGKLLVDHNTVLVKELTQRYMEFIVSIDNKIANGSKLSSEDSSQFNERVAYVLKNMHVMEFNKEKSMRYLHYLGDLKNRVKNNQLRK